MYFKWRGKAGGKIQRVSSDKVQAFDDYGRQLLDTTFNNELIEGLPFGINICLDYAVASTTTDKYRMAQLKIPSLNWIL